MAHNPNEPTQSTPGINPATGLPMVDDTWTDVGGSPYGHDIYQPAWVPLALSYDNWQPSWDGF